MAIGPAPADIVKALHARLREEVHSGEVKMANVVMIQHSIWSAGHNIEEVWCKLLADKPSLETYSYAMRTLAIGSWEENGLRKASRIQWCVQVCSEYFKQHGALHTLLLKDLRRRDHDMPTTVPLPLLPSSLEGVIEIVENYSLTLNLLDVGSCYNPFRHYSQFHVTAIDLAPADEVELSGLMCIELSYSCTPRVYWNVTFSLLLSLVKKLLLLLTIPLQP